MLLNVSVCNEVKKKSVGANTMAISLVIKISESKVGAIHKQTKVGSGPACMSAQSHERSVPV